MDYFEYVDNFKKTEDVETQLIQGALSLSKVSFTILIPTYQRSMLLKQALDSALAQDNFDDFEVLVLDNEPQRNDETEILLRSYSNTNLLYYKNDQNLGMAGNWNRGFLLSRSHWVILLHDDDVMSPYFLNVVSKYLEKDNDCAILKPISQRFSDIIPDFSIKSKKAKYSRLYFFDFMLNCAVGAPTNTVFNRDAVISLGGFNQDYYPAYDYVFAARCAEVCKLYSLPIVLGGYRINANESLNYDTMDKYFINRFAIRHEVMAKLGLPSFIIKLIQSITYQKAVNETNDYYGTNYQLHIATYHFWIIPKPISYLSQFVFFKLTSVIRRIKYLK